MSKLGVKINPVDLGLSYPTTSPNLCIYTSPIIPGGKVFPASQMGIDQRTTKIPRPYLVVNLEGVYGKELEGADNWKKK